MTSITEHFALEEFKCPKSGDVPEAQYPQEWIEERLRPLCIQLELIRTELGNRPIKIYSGYRSPAFNAQIGGAKKSQHMEGRAADIHIGGVDAKLVHDTILKMYNAKILTIKGLGQYPTFTHVDIRPSQKLVRWTGSRPMDHADELG